MKKIILILLAFCLNACTENDESCGSYKTKTFENYEPQCGYFLKNVAEKPTNVVINSQKVLDSLFTDSRAVVNCFAPSGPDFDLSKKTYLAVFAGVKPTGGYAIKIQNIQENDCEIVVEYYEKAPNTTDIVAQVTTYPVDYAVIAKTNKRIIFKKVNYSGDYIVIGSICNGMCVGNMIQKYRIDANTTARFVSDNTGGGTYQKMMVNGDLFGFLSNVPQEVKALKGQTKEYINNQVADGGTCYFEYHQEGVMTKVVFTNFFTEDKDKQALVEFQNYIYNRISLLNKAN